MTRRSDHAAAYAPGDRVVWNPARWSAGEFDAWGRGYGLGKVLAHPFDAAAPGVDVRWPCGRAFERFDQLRGIEHVADQRPLPPAFAASALRRGCILAYPTEGVWGLGCDPQDAAAVQRLLAVKQRDIAKGMILIAGGEAQLAPFVDMQALGAASHQAVRDSWPGPHTWIVPASHDAPRWITGDHDGIAVRVSAHPQVVALCAAFGGALVSTSANLSGQAAPRSRAALDPALLALLDGVLDGETGGLAQATPIRDARTGAVLRA